MQPAAALFCALCLCLSAVGPSEQFRLPWTKARQHSFEDFEKETGLSQLGDPVGGNKEVVFVGVPDRTHSAKSAAYQEAARSPLDEEGEVEEPLLVKKTFVYGPDHEEDIRPAEPPEEQPDDGEYPLPPDDKVSSNNAGRVSIPEWWLTKGGRNITRLLSEESEGESST